MQHISQTLFICLPEILLIALPRIGSFSKLAVIMEQISRVLGIGVCNFSVDEVFLRQVII